MLCKKSFSVNANFTSSPVYQFMITLAAKHKQKPAQLSTADPFMRDMQIG